MFRRCALPRRRARSCCSQGRAVTRQLFRAARPPPSPPPGLKPRHQKPRRLILCLLLPNLTDLEASSARPPSSSILVTPAAHLQSQPPKQEQQLAAEPKPKPAIGGGRLRSTWGFLPSSGRSGSFDRALPGARPRPSLRSPPREAALTLSPFAPYRPFLFSESRSPTAWHHSLRASVPRRLLPRPLHVLAHHSFLPCGRTSMTAFPYMPPILLNGL